MSENFKFHVDKGVSHLTVTHKEGLHDQAPLKIGIIGNIDSVFNWIKLRAIGTTSGDPEPDCDRSERVEPVNEKGNFFLQKEAYILIDREKMTMQLVFNENDPHVKSDIIGRLEFHPDFEKWGINEGSEWSHKKFAEFCKMNRSFFANPVDAMSLFNELSNISIKVEKEMENSDNNRGDTRHLSAQKVIKSNIPEKFELFVPIFKGLEKARFVVEVYVNPNNYGVTLVSPDAQDFINEYRETAIDTQKDLIQSVAPSIVIIEK